MDVVMEYWSRIQLLNLVTSPSTISKICECQTGVRFIIQRALGQMMLKDPVRHV